MTDIAPVIIVRHPFAAPAERVFDAWIDPVVAARWLFATPDGQIVRCDIDPCIGGEMVITDRRAGDDVEHHARFVAMDRPRRLAFIFTVPKYSSVETTVTIEIAPSASGCDLVLSHEHVLPEWAASTEQGWRDLLAGLDAQLRG